MSATPCSPSSKSLRNSADAARSSSQLRVVVTGIVLLALAGAGSVGVLMSIGDAPPRPMATVPPATAHIVPGPGPAMAPHRPHPTHGPVTRRVAVVRNGRAVAYRNPDRSTPAVATLQSGMPVVVRRVFSTPGAMGGGRGGQHARLRADHRYRPLLKRRA